MAVCFVHVTAKLIPDGANTYWVPVFGAPIKFGEKGGPNLTQLKHGLTLRARFVETQGALPWAREDAAPALPRRHVSGEALRRADAPAGAARPAAEAALTAAATATPTRTTAANFENPAGGLAQARRLHPSQRPRRRSNEVQKL